MDSVAAEVVNLLVGFRIQRVRYLMPHAMRGSEAEPGGGFEHAESGVVLADGDGGTRTLRWAQHGFEEALWIGVGDGIGNMNAFWVPDAVEVPAPSWDRFIGSEIRSVSIAWQSLDSACFSIWAVRLDLGRHSIAIALGERHERSGVLTYVPDCVAVIFEEVVGRQYRPRSALGSAWEESHELPGS